MVKKRVTFDEENLKENEKYLKSKNFTKFKDEKTPFRRDDVDYNALDARFDSESTDANNENVWSDSSDLSNNSTGNINDADKSRKDDKQRNIPNERS